LLGYYAPKQSQVEEILHTLQIKQLKKVLIIKSLMSLTKKKRIEYIYREEEEP